MKIAVLFTKRECMSRSYRLDWEGREKNDDADSVIRALKEIGHEATIYHVDLGLFERLRKDKKGIDLAFNLCDDGFFSDAELEPHLAAMLDILGIPYTGGNYLTLALTMKKDAAKRILISNSLPTPKFQVFQHPDEEIMLSYPLIAKPIHEDASIGIDDGSVAYDEEALRKKIAHIIKEYRQPALVEEFIDGREFNVAVIGNDEILPVSEITFDSLPEGKPHIVGYGAKWKEGSIEYKETKRSCPAKINKELELKLSKLALEAGSIFQCRDYFRVDFRVDKKDQPYILEVNQNPDLSEGAGLTAMAKAKGYSYKELVAKIAESASARQYGNKH